ncbi:hypothetical protein SAMN04488527_101266 [Aliiroseovarius crassostreae]|nr:hypothetical protein [Aliiroseovarius crassostreae]SFU31272.1 hypothetical protein SAMN04488527_101266 [Aliiroseovarius crassostreae]
MKVGMDKGSEHGDFGAMFIEAKVAASMGRLDATMFVRSIIHDGRDPLSVLVVKIGDQESFFPVEHVHSALQQVCPELDAEPEGEGRYRAKPGYMKGEDNG